MLNIIKERLFIINYPGILLNSQITKKNNKMSSGRNSRSLRSDYEKTLLKMMIDFEVDQTDISKHEGVSPQAINNRLKRLNGDKVEDFKKLIRAVAAKNLGKNGAF